MSQTTKEINKITGAIIGISSRLIIYALVALLLYEGVTKGFEFGHEIFFATSMEEAPGTEYTIVVDKGESISEVAKTLRSMRLINNEYSFIIQAKFFDYGMNPGSYKLSTAMTSKEMLQMMDENKPEEEKE